LTFAAFHGPAGGAQALPGGEAAECTLYIRHHVLRLARPRDRGSPGAPRCRLTGHKAWASGPRWRMGERSPVIEPRPKGLMLSLGFAGFAGDPDDEAQPVGVGRQDPMPEIG